MEIMFKHLNLEIRKDPKEGSDWLWPIEDTWCWHHLNKSRFRDLPKKIAENCKEKKLVIQAGGNAGYYPKQYSKLFDTVITFEPDHRNFYCLSYNVPEENVFKFRACVGNSNSPLGLELHKDHDLNLGGLRISGTGIIPQIQIDCLGVSPSLMHLDIEGFEGFALLGAEETIKKSKPIIVLEINGFGDPYGWPKEKINALLTDWGYMEYRVFESDIMFVYKDFA
jgi:FkbM family methyltransferase